MNLRAPAPHDSLTAWQLVALENTYNLSDGHARQGLTEQESAVASSIGAGITAPYASLSQRVCEADFAYAFLSATRENPNLGNALSTRFLYSASMGISVVAAALSARSLTSVAVLHPTFDNIPQLLVRNGLTIFPISESELENSQFDALVRADALFLTLPNNPTGWNLAPAAFESLLQFCETRGIQLILDMTFRFQDLSMVIYDPLAIHTQLAWVSIEDTGKTWDLNDIKASFIVSRAPQLETALRLAADEILLNVSPVMLKTLTGVIDATTKNDGIAARVNLANRNRAYICTKLSDLVCDESFSRQGFVAWLRLPNHINPRSLSELAERRGVSILPGDQFEWASSKPSQHIRVALMRSAVYFDNACALLLNSFRSYASR